MNQSKDATLHQRIVSDIEGRIVSGEWPPGHRIPFELDLTKEYDCSRMTVNKALTQLAKAGLIERRKKSGSFVTQPQAQSAVLEIHDIRAEVQSLNLSYAFTVSKREQRKAKAEDIRRLDVAPGSSVVDVVCVHLAGGRPFCLEQRLISLATVPEAATADFSETAPGAWLINQIPWSSAEHRIHAVSAGPDEAAALDIARHTACLVVERRTWSNVGPVTHVRFTYPGDRHALVARFAPASQ
ncbi:histidine utilization repressor (plasmid) [Rhizobium grahamii]|uniref:Histidine utilization repressor n=1 Tax=Rhizobium grahamii TaxID=1120045 RepID=A0A5Q0CBN8_9HYPH|nr:MULTISPECIES: histidine utilization repressor [Rhizobium]QFY62843.1 histidine utilization repressor [Rhizobium grahamii]QRM52411.1 histidine utilization repressor [Rhizobium sp. BG6]